MAVCLTTKRGSRVTALEIPGALSWLAYGDLDAEVRGLDDFPAADAPATRVVHVGFQLMVGAGVFLLLTAAWAALGAWRGRLFDNRLFLLLLFASGPLSLVALQAGWVVTEVGRQPWIVHGVMRTADAVTMAPGIPYVLTVTLAIYATLFAGTLIVLRKLVNTPLPEADRGH